MATMGMNSSKQEIPSRGSIGVEKNSPCLVFQPEASVNAEFLERRNKSWSVKAIDVSDLMIQVGEDVFYLDKLSMASRSGYINRLLLQSNAGNSTSTSTSIKIDNLPGGAKMFELVVKFSYGMKINLTAVNIGPLYCAANFLEMSDDLKPGNLISVTEAFISYVILSSWKGTFRILRSCETVSSWAKYLQILKQCAESIAWKVCTEKKSSDFVSDEMFKEKELREDWWFEDVSCLRIDHFDEVISAVKKKKIKPELVGSCITHWTMKWLSQITITNKNLNHKSLAIRLNRVTAENIIRILPAEANSISCNFQLHLYKIGLIVQVNSGLLSQLERRIALGLESCKATDLLIRNSLTLFDVDIVIKVIQTYASYASTNQQSKISVVGRLMDEYLMLVAREVNLPATSFQSLIEALPKNARSCNDNLYRAIDMYLKAHPNLTEEDRNNICRGIDHYKLSQEARKHATKNDRLPLHMATQFILLEQVAMTRTLTAVGSNYQRTKSQAISRLNKVSGKEWMKSSKEVEAMKHDVERLKFQLGELQLCRLEIRKQVKARCI